MWFYENVRRATVRAQPRAGGLVYDVVSAQPWSHLWLLVLARPPAMLAFSSSSHRTNASLFVSAPRAPRAPSTMPPHIRHAAMLTRTASEILPRLWLSGLYTAVDEEQLVALGVTHVVSLIEDRPRYPRTLPKLKTLHVSLPDVESADILRHLDATTAFIKSALEDERNVVLVRLSPSLKFSLLLLPFLGRLALLADASRAQVHCAMGISRSATAVCAFLVAERGFPPADALAHVVARRAIVCPNAGFRRQLDVFHARRFGTRKLRKPWRPSALPSPTPAHVPAHVPAVHKPKPIAKPGPVYPSPSLRSRPRAASSAQAQGHAWLAPSVPILVPVPVAPSRTSRRGSFS